MGNPMQNETPATPPTCPPVVCPDWCTSTTGHAEVHDVEDQWHQGESHKVTLSREPLVSYGRTFEMEYLSVQSSSVEGPDSPLCVRLTIGDERDIKLTHGETLALMDAFSRSAEDIHPNRLRRQQERGEGLTMLREAMNISIEDFAAHMGRSPVDMRAHEAGDCMDTGTVSRFTRALTAMFTAQKRAA